MNSFQLTIELDDIKFEVSGNLDSDGEVVLGEYYTILNDIEGNEVLIPGNILIDFSNREEELIEKISSIVCEESYWEPDPDEEYDRRKCEE